MKMTISDEQLKFIKNIDKIKSDLKKLAIISKYSMETVDCTAGVYCENLQKIRGILNDKITE